jgi:RNA polymerase sigma factor (sigma-70 family)
VQSTLVLTYINTQSIKQLTEQELIKGCIRQDKLYQKLLFSTFSGRFMTICLRYASNKMEAEDMMQEGFMAIFNNISQFKSIGSFEGWLCKIMVNACLRVLSKKRIQIVNSDDIEVQYISTTDYSHLTEKEILKLINALPIGYKLVFNLVVVEGYTHDEVAEMLHIQASTSRSQLVKARKMLQQKIIELQKIAV